MGPLASLDLVQGPVPIAAAALAVPAAVYLLARRWRRRALFPLIAAALAVLAAWAAGQWATASGLSTHPLPTIVLAWVGAGAFALLLAAAGILAGPWLRRFLAPLAAVLVLSAAALQVNAYYGQYRTVADLTGVSTAGIAPLAAPAAQPVQQATAAAVPVAGWVPPPSMPAHGQVRSAHIPGSASGFAARTGYVYLPPAYTVPGHPPLPVLVLIPGQPGSPADWLTAGRLQPILDAYAAAHHGMAPVTVIPDVNGTPTGNTMCMDSRIARADTYLSVDVPAWIKASLDVSHSAAQWAIGGFSFGGTCAIQMATLHPGVYPNALDFSGEAEPALGPDRAATIRTAFGGDTAAFDALTPLHQLAARHYPNTWAYFAAGGQDPQFSAYMHRVATAAAQAGMTTRVQTVPGTGHSWTVPTTALTPALDWLGHRLALTP